MCIFIDVCKQKIKNVIPTAVKSVDEAHLIHGYC